MFNVSLNDLAVVVSPLFPENKGRVCKIVGVKDDNDMGRFWRCSFTTPARTVIGPSTIAILNDKQLRRLVGDVPAKFAEERKELFETA